MYPLNHPAMKIKLSLLAIVFLQFQLSYGQATDNCVPV